MTKKQNEITSEEFQEIIEATANVMTSYHLRLLRVEEWMLKQEGVSENEEREVTN